MATFIKGTPIGSEGNLRAYARATLRVGEGEERVCSWVLRCTLSNTCRKFKNQRTLMQNMYARSSPHRVEHEWSGWELEDAGE
jgi:hypothetical protein